MFNDHVFNAFMRSFEARRETEMSMAEYLQACRDDPLVYANAAFLTRMGYAHLHALEEAGGLDALYVEPGVSTGSSTSTGSTQTTTAAQTVSSSGLPTTGADLAAMIGGALAAIALGVVSLLTMRRRRTARI